MKRITHVFSLATVFLFISVVSGVCENAQAIYDDYKKTEKKMEKILENMMMTLTMERDGNLTETVIYIKGKKRRMETVVKKTTNPMMGKPGDKTIMIDDGFTSTMFSPLFGKISSPSEADDDQEEAPTSVEYLGQETVEGFKCHKIKVTRPYEEEETLWIAKGKTLVKAELIINGNTMVTVNTAFKKVKGFLLPHATQIYENGVLAGTTSVKKVKTDTSIDESLFDPAMVTGYENSASPSGGPQFSDQAQMMGQMMQLGMEIERLNREGRTEEAKALQKKLEAMAAGMEGAPQ